MLHFYHRITSGLSFAEVSVMKKYTLGFIGLVVFSGSVSFAGSAEDDRQARICAQLRNGAFGRTGALHINEDTCGKQAGSTTAPVLIGKPEAELRSSLADLGVQYLFNFNKTDLLKQQGSNKYLIPDFMGHAIAESRTDNFTAQVCALKDGTSSESFARFDRFSADDSVGGYLLVKENDPTITNLKVDDGFTMGAWVKIKADYSHSDVRTNDGYFPILSKTPLNTDPVIGKTEWEFKVTSEVMYLNINRGGQYQNNLNVKLPWWADRFGSCYQYGIHQECWHFVSISVNQTKHTYSVLFLKKFTDSLPGNTTESFQNYETNVSQDNTPIEASAKTALRIGGSNTNTMDGMLKGVFFSKKALSQSEMRAIAELTAPVKEAMMNCSPVR